MSGAILKRKRLMWRTSPVRPKLLVLTIAGLAGALTGAPLPLAASDIPPWLRPHVGVGENQITPVVLRRARTHYYRKLRQGAVRNPCYFAMDATRPAGSGRRFYVICEAQRSFQAIPAAHGNGRKLEKVADFSNETRCAKNFSNALHSRLTAGGPYTTAEIRTSFKGYYRASGGQLTPLKRSFVQFEGEGETANARPRAIGGHPAVIVSPVCRMKVPGSRYADKDGYVPYGRLRNYSNGRSYGCTSWSPEDSQKIFSILGNSPTTLYIYPESTDIVAVARAVKAGMSVASMGLYWNTSCLREIGAPNFWPRDTLEPILVKHRKANRRPPPDPLPLCKGVSASLGGTGSSFR